MVYKIDDYSKVEKLFNGWPYENWHTVMNQKVRIYVDNPDSPKSAVGCLGGWWFCVGEPNKKLITQKQKKWFGLFPKDKKWEKLIRYGIDRGEFNDVDVTEIVNLILYSYQGIRMWSRIMPMKPGTFRSIRENIKKQLIKGDKK